MNDRPAEAGKPAISHQNVMTGIRRLPSRINRSLEEKPGDPGANSKLDNKNEYLLKHEAPPGKAPKDSCLPRMTLGGFLGSNDALACFINFCQSKLTSSPAS